MGIKDVSNRRYNVGSQIEGIDTDVDRRSSFMYPRL